MTDLSLVGNCSQAMEAVAGQRPANVARMERNSDDPILEKFVLQLKRQDEQGCWESNSSPLLMMYDVRLVGPCINEAIGNESSDGNLILLYVITHVYLTMMTGDCGGRGRGVVLPVFARVSPGLVCRLVTVSIQRGDPVGAARAESRKIVDPLLMQL